MPTEQVATVLPDLVCVAVCLYAAVVDLRERRIPNPLTYGAVGLGLGLNFGLYAVGGGPAAGLTAGLLPSLAGGALLFGVFFALSMAGMMGMGDAKLMAAVGVLLRWPLAPWALVHVLLAGGALSVGYAVYTGRLGAVVKNILRGGGALVRGRKPSEKVEVHRIPYGAAIFVGVAWTVASRYLPVLRIL
jgi:Flp pilus assembly protein protease CpaA